MNRAAYSTLRLDADRVRPFDDPSTMKDGRPRRNRPFFGLDQEADQHQLHDPRRMVDRDGAALAEAAVDTVIAVNSAVAAHSAPMKRRISTYFLGGIKRL